MTPVFRRAERDGAKIGRRRGHVDSIDGLLYQGVASFRRRIIIGATLAVLLLAGISGAVAWRQYDDARARAANDLKARVVAVSAVVDSSFAGQISTLDAIAKAPSVVNVEAALMSAYFRRINPKRHAAFSGGLGWINRKGLVEATSNPGG